MRFAIAGLCLLGSWGLPWSSSGWLAVRLPAQEPAAPAEKPATSPTPEEQAALAEGQALFRGLCSGCHGGAGRGGKGPDLTRGRFIHGNKDEDLARVIREGVPKSTMKKFGEARSRTSRSPT